MKTAIYYLKSREMIENKKGEMVEQIKKAVTIVVLSEDGHTARGVAICSPEDQFSQKGVDGGRSRAIGRAMRALHKEKTTGKIDRKEALNVILSCTTEEFDPVDVYTHKSVYMPELTDYEKQLLEKVPNLEEPEFLQYVDKLVYGDF